MARLAIGVDIGGTGIKVALVDLDRGSFASERLRVRTPQPATPKAVIAATAGLVERLRQLPDGRAVALAGIGIPSVVMHGATKSAANIDDGWIGFAAEPAFGAALGLPVALVNDADAAGLAEMRFGAGRGRDGVVLVLTIGTGVGSGLFVDGRLVPNTELGHLQIRGRDAERRSSAVARQRRHLSWKRWAKDLDEHLDTIDRLLSPDLIILGGGISKVADRFMPYLSVGRPIEPAQLLNDAGIVGAALFAGERAGEVPLTPGVSVAAPGQAPPDGPG